MKARRARAPWFPVPPPAFRQQAQVRALLSGPVDLERGRLTKASAAHSSWTNRIIGCKDHSSIQINIAHLDENGVVTSGATTFALSGEVREKVRKQNCPPPRPLPPPPPPLPPQAPSMRLSASWGPPPWSRAAPQDRACL